QAERTQLLNRTPDPVAVLERATKLQEQLRFVASEHHATRDQAIREELAQVPPWLTATLGPEPQEGDRRDRWQRAARELAGHRIDHHMTSAASAVSDDLRDTALQR